MVYPSIDTYIDDAKRFNVIPVFRELCADFETPISICAKVKAKFLLESVEQGKYVGRFSFIGLGKKTVIALRGRQCTISEFKNGTKTRERTYEATNPFVKIGEYFRTLTTPAYNGLPPFFGGAIGFLGYEIVQYFERVPIKENDSAIPDGLLIIPEVLLAYDSVRRSTIVIVSTTPGADPRNAYHEALKTIGDIAAQLASPSKFGHPHQAKPGDTRLNSNVTRDNFLDSVRKCKDYIGNGDIIQAVISQRFSFETKSTPFELYRSLRIINPSPYMYLLDFDDFAIVGSSPEVMVKVQDGELLLKPIAGTRRRGNSIAEDKTIADGLLSDEKERAEHLMLVDLGRNDLGRVAVPGSVDVTDFMVIEKYSHVMHIVSTIKAQLDDAHDVFDVIRATFPAGTLTGAPKIRAMEIISELERARRGPYGGMILYLCFNGNMDSCITIRTIIVEHGSAIVQAGAGIVADSIPENEYEETINKAMALIKVITGSSAGEGYDSPHR